jgi:rare lipoprotein A
MPAKARRRAASIAAVALLGLLLAGCASQSLQVASQAGYWGGRGAGYYRVGNPYKINGIWYFPAVDYDYDRTGVASWYGEQFAGRLTANGEIFDLNELTAAHTTLPMPSIIQVTNLENGRSLQLRVNDRGPFVDGRLIDVSRRAAQLLGFEGHGTTLVRVKVLKDESIAAAEEATRNSGLGVVADAGATAAMTIQAPPAAAYAAPPSVIARAPAAFAAPALPPKPPAPLPAQPAAPPVIATASPEPVVAETGPLRSPGRERPLQTASPALAPATARPAHSPFSRFALISPAEAAEMPVPRRPMLAARPRPAPEKANSPVKVATAPAARIYVQAGAFSMPDNARRVQQHLARWGAAQVTTVSVRGVEMYRVRFGPFQSAAQARGLVVRLVEGGYREARIVGD